jgi:membrane protease YdiL (CAAX protease family)
MWFTGMAGWVVAALEPLALPLRRLDPVSWLAAFAAYAPLKALLPVPILAAIAPALYWFFRDTWRDIDREALALRQAELGSEAGPSMDYRPAACLVITAVVLTLQEYYGGRTFFYQSLRGELSSLNQSLPWLKFDKYEELYGYGWWCVARVIGYTLVPLPLWKLLFPKDSILDMGLRTGGFFKHLWIYGACLAIVLPVMLIVATQSDFGTYYPFYKKSSRSWFDLLLWEAMYFGQFFALELFFRGWMVGALRRSLGSAAIFVMAVPYCMIHYGKPYLEAHGAIVAGVVLGSLAMRTRSIYSGFLLHITVALGMDLLALYKRGALPQTFWASG